MTLRFSTPAQHDLFAIHAYIAERDVAAAGRVIARLREVAARLAHNPHLGRPTSRKNVRVFSVRTYPYVMFYEIRDDEVVVVHVRHTARRPWNELE